MKEGGCRVHGGRWREGCEEPATLRYKPGVRGPAVQTRRKEPGKSILSTGRAPEAGGEERAGGSRGGEAAAEEAGG